MTTVQQFGVLAVALIAFVYGYYLGYDRHDTVLKRALERGRQLDQAAAIARAVIQADPDADMLAQMQATLGPRWYHIGAGKWQHEETGNICEPDLINRVFRYPDAKEQYDQTL